MKCNVGKIDRAIRILVGLGIIALGLYYKSYWGALGAVPILTGILGFCPAYAPFGIDTCKLERKDEQK